MAIIFCRQSIKTLFLLGCFLVVSCGQRKEERQKRLYDTYCASCHIAPDIQDLPKRIWSRYVLPEMGARMGIKDSLYDLTREFSYEEQYAIGKTGIFPYTPIISEEDWQLLKAYVLKLAPDTLLPGPKANRSKRLTQFAASPVTLDSIGRSLITFMDYDAEHKQLLTGDVNGFLTTYDLGNTASVQRKKFRSAITDYTRKGETGFVTTVGQLDPSEVALGSIALETKDTISYLPEVIHRPVHTLVHDLDKDGTDELVVSEFGYFTGKLSLFTKEEGKYIKKVLLNQPGVIRVLAEDMDHDGKEDLVALVSQGSESISILYQKEALEFRSEKAIEFSPIYGSSWFELIDYDGDGDKDIITVNGDNADKSVTLKPYHGMRIHINGGDNTFTETYFYPLNGVTRVVARDFDEDGDVDFGLMAAFPDYFNHPEFSFVYLENKDADNFSFEPYTFETAKNGRWLLMDTEDVDGDGDQDIVLSSFSYVFSPVPKELQALWDREKAHIMILRNTLR
ncbi:FG-GAP-like repeat-containing protein [Spongiimicrobium salis]|uniref:FG-GAP-like repeat-containing protein n=1 Tax=Spongiimicrobium salis TaxID=1667022 RepID=UPI00374D5596